jgi:8-amino-7-oxononanoate synthase
MKYIQEALDEITTKLTYPVIPTLQSAADPEIMVDGRKILLFCSNDYLAMANHPDVKKAAHQAIDTHGVSTCASRLVAGNTDLHNKLERLIADFLHREDSVVFPTGFMTNSGTISAVVKGINAFRVFPKKTVIISEELNHASIIDGCTLTKAKVEQYPHRDMKALERLLKKYRNERKLVISDAVFSMDGDIAPVDVMVGLKKKYDALLMVDEAHSIGVLGKTGRGVLEHFGLPFDSVDILMGTISKGIGTMGGYVAGSKVLADFLRIMARSYMFTASPLPPPLTAAAIASFNFIIKNPLRVEMLRVQSEKLRIAFRKNGFDILDTETPIIPLMLYDEKKAINFSKCLFDEGVLAPCVRWPAVEKGRARIRFVLMATHTDEQIQRLVDACVKVRNASAA